MPIPFLEALRGRLAPVFNGTVPLEREKEERDLKGGPGWPGKGGGGTAETGGTNTQQFWLALKWRQVHIVREEEL